MTNDYRTPYNFDWFMIYWSYALRLFIYIYFNYKMITSYSAIVIIVFFIIVITKYIGRRKMYVIYVMRFCMVYLFQIKLQQNRKHYVLLPVKQHYNVTSAALIDAQKWPSNGRTFD